MTTVKEKKYRLNTTDQPVFLMHGKALNDLAWLVVQDVNKMLLASEGLTGVSPDQIRTKDKKALFVKMFGGEPVGQINEKFLIKATELCRIDNTPALCNSVGLLDQLTFKTSENDPRHIGAYSDSLSPSAYAVSVRTGLTLLLVGLWKKGAVLLPGNLNMLWFKWLDDNDTLLQPFVTEITAMLRRFRCDESFESKIRNSKTNLHTIRLIATKHTQFLHATDLHDKSSLTISGLSDLWLQYAKDSTECKTKEQHPFLPKGLSVYEFPDLLEEQFGLPFSLDDYHDARVNLFQKNRIFKSAVARSIKRRGGTPDPLESKKKVFSGRHLSGILAEMWPSEIEMSDADDYFYHIKTFNRRDHLSPSNLEAFWSEVVTTDEVKRAAKIWSKLQLSFINSKRYLSSASFRNTFGFLNLYLTYYLPAWFAENKTDKFEYPDTPNKLIGAIFVSRPVEPDYPVPRTIFEMLEMLVAEKGIGANTFKGYVSGLKQFFDHIEKFRDSYSDVLGGVDNFNSPIDENEIPKGVRHRNVQKATFPNRHFKTILNYVSALMTYQDLVADKVETGELDIDALMAERILDLTKLPLQQPIVDHFGRKFPIRLVPNFLRTIKVRTKDGFEGSTIYPGFVRHNYLMLETGIRGAQLSWLDESSYDQFVDKEQDNYLVPLYVNTNKDGYPWHAVVANRVIKILDKQRAWKDRIDNDGFALPCDYSDECKNAYEKIYPVFSYNQENGKPFAYQEYADTWQKLLLGFQWFLKYYNIDNATYVKYLPTGVGGNIEKMWDSSLAANQAKFRSKAKIELTSHGDEYCPVSLRSLVTPHGARATVVSESVTVLPEEYVGTYITGQFNVRTVHYYNRPDADQIARTRKHQHREMETARDLKSGTVSVDDPLMNECRKVNEQLAESVAKGKDISLDAGVFSIAMILENTESRDSLALIKAGKARRLGKNPSHLCVFNNICPKELVDLWGQTRLCGICPYAINHIKHLPAISAMRDKSWEDYEYDKEHYITFRKRNDVSDDEKAKVEQTLLWRNFDALGWELREMALLRKAEQIANGEHIGEFLVERPEEVVAYVENQHIQSDETDYLLKRLRDCIAFPLTDSRIIAAKMDLVARKLLMHAGKTREALAYRNPSTAAADLYSLLHSYQDMSGLSHAEIFGLLTTELLEMAKEAQAKLGNGSVLSLEAV